MTTAAWRIIPESSQIRFSGAIDFLDATVDVKQRLHDLLREAGIDPNLVQEASSRR
jgi:hypothetical protein